MKRTLFFTVCLFLITLFSVNNILANVFPITSLQNNFSKVGCGVVPTHSISKATFCAGFNTDAICGCNEERQSPRICNAGAKVIYTDLIQPLGIPLICHLHRPVGISWQECIDQWNCYISGTAGNPSDHECFGQASATGC